MAYANERCRDALNTAVPTQTGASLGWNGEDRRGAQWRDEAPERTRLIAALHLAEAEARRANHANDAQLRFLAAASHDLRQPLTALALYSEVLLVRLGRDDAALAADMRNCIDGLTELLTELLDLSKLQAGVVAPHIRAFDVNDLMQKVVSAHRPDAHRRGLRLRHRPSALRVRSDPVLLGRVVRNLVANAIRFTPHGGVLIGCRRIDGRTWLTVWDTGVGLAADSIDLMFGEFTQLGNEARSDDKGSGLGLAIVARTAALLGLQLRVRSRIGRGSLFAVELPVC